jgi:hypothetical protein
MMNLLRGGPGACRRRPVLAGLPALALLTGVVPAVPATVNKPRALQASGSRCSVGYLQSGLHLANVTVDSATLNTTGTFTPPPGSFGPPSLTGLPPFCDATLTQADPAGNPIHIEVWLPEPWNGRRSTTPSTRRPRIRPPSGCTPRAPPGRRRPRCTARRYPRRVRDLRRPGARHPARRPVPVRLQGLLRLRPRELRAVPDVGRGRRRPRPSPARPEIMAERVRPYGATARNAA